MSRASMLEAAPQVRSPDGRTGPSRNTAIDADVAHLTDPSSEHTMEALPALDEEIARASTAVQEVLAAVHRLRQLRGLRRAVEEGLSLQPHGSDTPQEVLQHAALLKELGATLGTKPPKPDDDIAAAESELSSAIERNQQAVDRLRYLQALRSAIAPHHDDAVTVEV